MLSLTGTVLISTWVDGYKAGTGYIKRWPYMFSLGYFNGELFIEKLFFLCGQ